MSAVFTLQDGRFVPSGHARGPWDAGSQHGGAPAALIARAVERLDAPGPMLLARLTVEFLGAVPLAPLEVRAEVVRPGRRLQLIEATVTSEDAVLCRARAVRLRREAVAVPESAIPAPRVAAPDDLAGWQMGTPAHGATQGFGQTAMELRFADGHFSRPGPATAWFRLTMPLVAGEEPTPTQRAVAAADFGNGLGAELGFDDHLFVNTDLSVHLLREPVGEWIAVEAVTEHGPEGTALATSTLHDADGPVGHAAQSLFVAPR
ncbi:MAG: thioesterase family protein [Solirubrobacterales bacterium]|nr:thioesterase family protein [Solirubrobacterales bacterium]